ncbi:MULTISPECIES: siderophore ABC transporter substrate-binding protein [Actinoalloteichus]|uniref:Iron complex transport system substrate-binding protein n=2 Tax=Actinoalloteichus cyanogriseus TaxID=2893586 RepID=A0ABT1JE08_ACTCY|nr:MULTISPECIES: ABC transporter substrate-binding protein [Actinoalloteichus]MCP2330648.1 iron complex transport system substrate-binding protein [Actinoalloteichus caeruleus DSM 43889]
MPTMFSRRPLGVLGAVSAAALVLASCAAPPEETSDDVDVVTVVDNHGEIEVPVNPRRLVALDNTTFQTLSDWDVDVAAVPKPLMHDLWPDLSDDPSVLDVGSHREPNLEAVIEADPDLVIGGYRFASVYEDLKDIQPRTVEINARDGEDQVAELRRQVEILGQIFDREDDAAAIVDELDTAITAAADAYNGTDTVVGLITSGGDISYAAPGSGRGVGLLFPTLDLVPGIEQAAEDSTHGDDISVEAIAQANPEWLVVLDRDATFDEEGYVPAAELIEGSEALANVPAVRKGQVIYLEPGFYLDEGIQAYTTLFDAVATAFADAE